MEEEGVGVEPSVLQVWEAMRESASVGQTGNHPPDSIDIEAQLLFKGE